MTSPSHADVEIDAGAAALLNATNGGVHLGWACMQSSSQSEICNPGNRVFFFPFFFLGYALQARLDGLVEAAGEWRSGSAVPA